MADIKSAREIALEKIAGVGEATEGDRLKWKYVPEGEALALKFVKEAKVDLNTELASYPDKARAYVKIGAESVLISAIALPRVKTQGEQNERAMEGLLALKKDRAQAAKVIAQVKQVLGHYTSQGAEQKKRTYEGLKREFGAKLKQAVDRRLGAAVSAEELDISVETLPQFQEEWRRTESQFEAQYETLIGEFKLELKRIK